MSGIRSYEGCCLSETTEGMAEASSQVIWKGRMEGGTAGCFTAMDTHQCGGTVCREREENSTGQGTILLFSAVQDKDYEQMIAYLCRQVDAEIYLVTQIQDKRAERGEY